MTKIFTYLLSWLTDISASIPTFSIGSDVLNNLSGALTELVVFLNQVNFIIPLSDIAVIIGIIVSIRLFKISVFIINWVIRRIVDAIP